MATAPAKTPPVEEEVDENKINVVLKNGETVYLNFLRLKRLPPALWNEKTFPLTALKNLELSCNHLDTLPAEIALLQNIHVLSLGVNRIQQLPPELSQLQRLININLTRNSMTAIPECILRLALLRNLNLSFNKIKEIPKDFCLRLTNLQQLNFANNLISAVPEGLPRLSQLTELDISVNALSSAPVELGDLRNLSRLDLGVNSLSVFPLFLPTTLQLLSLHTNQIRSLPSTLKTLVNLTSLDISYNELGALALDAAELLSITTLKSLNLTGNDVPDNYALAPDDKRAVIRNVAPSRILPDLFLGNWDSARNKYILRRLGVTHVICIAHDIKPSHPRDFTYLHIEIDDTANEPIGTYFSRTNAFIADAIQKGGKVLVHCAAGISRSATLVIAYIMREQRKSLEEARTLVAEQRPIICPNPGFLKQLAAYDAELRSEREACLLM